MLASRGTRVSAAALVVAGLSHHSAPLSVRERLDIDLEQWQATFQEPSVLLTTCNRVEAYAWATSRAPELGRRLGRALSKASGMNYADLAPFVFQHTGAAAVEHLVRVAAGLDSLVVGDEQIRGQVRAACDRARGSSPLPLPLEGIFTRAMEAGRRIRGGTFLGCHPSVAEAAIRVANDRLAAVEAVDRNALVLGAGAMAQAAARALLRAGWRVTLLNRTPEHAARVAEALGCSVTAQGLTALPHLLPRATLVVGATASRSAVLDVETVEHARADATGTLLIVDIAVPRDVQPAVRGLRGIQLLDLTDLERMCPVDAAQRQAEIARAERMAIEEADRIEQWLRMRTIVPTIVDLRQEGERIRSLELRRAERRLRDLTPEERQAVDAVTGAIVNKLLHGPTVLLREAAISGRPPRRSWAMLQEVLRLDRSRDLRGQFSAP